MPHNKNEIMNIGIDVKTLAKPYTGIAIYVHDILMYFNKLNHEDEFYLYSNRDFELDFQLNGNFHKVIYKSITGSFGVMFQLSRLLKRDKIDVFWGTEHCLVLGRHPFKQIVTIHDLAVLRNPKVGTRYNAYLQRIMTIPACKRADKIIAISEATKEDIISLSHVPPSKIKVIYNGDSPYTGKQPSYSSTFAHNVFVDYGIVSNEYFLFVGSIEPRKNISTIVKAYNQYRNSGGTKKLVLAGGLGWRYKAILRDIENSPFSRDIVQTGYCTPELKEFLYRNANALLFPSLWEGFGFPIVEAMSVGTPVITANISSMPEIAGKAALYIANPLDYKSLCHEMEHIEQMEGKELEQLKERGYVQAKLFSREQCAQEILATIHQLV